MTRPKHLTMSIEQRSLNLLGTLLALGPCPLIERVTEPMAWLLNLGFIECVDGKWAITDEGMEYYLDTTERLS